MKRRDFLLSSAALGSAGLLCPRVAGAQLPVPGAAAPLIKGGVYQAGSAAQLFVDQMVVRSADNVAFTLHPARKHPANPLMTADQPWEGWMVQISGNVIYDHQEQLFKMWYLGYGDEYLPPESGLYATSKDGLHWEKPPVGTVASEIPCRHNAVAAACGGPNVFKDTDDPDPARRYKMIACLQSKGGYNTMVSPDGLNWTLYSEEPIWPRRDVISGYFDRARRIWVAMAKTHSAKVPDLPHGRRVFSLLTSADFRTWSTPVEALYPDAKDDVGSLARIEEVRSMLDVPDDPELMRHRVLRDRILSSRKLHSGLSLDIHHQQ